MNAIFICLLIFVILSDCASGKLGKRPLKRAARHKHVESSEPNHLSSGESKQLGVDTGGDTKSLGREEGGSEKSVGNSQRSDEDSQISGEDSKMYGSKSRGSQSGGSGGKSKGSESESNRGESTELGEAYELMSQELVSSSEERPSPSPPKKKASKAFYVQWKKGTVPYRIDKTSYDEIIIRRIRESMKAIEAASCVIFKNMSRPPSRKGFWLHITNPERERDCVHGTRVGGRREKVMVIGFECMQKQEIIHGLLHALGFKDEVTHPQRDSYVRVLWENIQPKYHPLFAIKNEPLPYPTSVEYDTMSIMHFHDRAFSSNGGATVTPLISGLIINPSEALSQLDVMKLRLAFGHECNKRKVDTLMETCKNTLFLKGERESDSKGGDSRSRESKSNESKGGNRKKRGHKDDSKDRGSKGNTSDDDDNKNTLSGSDKDGENSNIDKSALFSDKKATESSSNDMAIIDISNISITTKKSINDSKENELKALIGSKWGVPTGKKRRGRSHGRTKSKKLKKIRRHATLKPKHRKTTTKKMKQVKQNKTKKHHLRKWQ